MKKYVLRLLVAAVVAAPSLAAFGQTVGTIEGHVFDQSGTPIRGVKVVATSPTQIGGPKTMVTGNDGLFRFPGLTPGVFTVTASAPKLKTVEQQNVKVSAVNTSEIDILMEVESVEEEVQVIQKAPLVNTQQATVGTDFDLDFVDKLPVSSRSFQGVAALTAGVTDPSGGGNPNVRGGASFNNSYTVDGFQTTDPVTHTFTENFTFSAMNQVQVRTAAFGAEYSDTLGGGVNIVTKSGSNRFEADVNASYIDQNLYLFKDSRDIGTNRLMVLELAGGGPILKDRLWFYASGQGVSNVFTLPEDPVLGKHPSESIAAFTGSFKLTWQLGPRNKIDFDTRYEPASFSNQLQSPLVEPEAEARQYQATRHFGVEWHGVLTDQLLLSLRTGINQNNVNVEPQSCVWDPNCANIPAINDVVTGQLRQNYPSQSRTLRQSVELSGSIEYFGDWRRLGSHHFKLGGRFQLDRFEAAQTTPGDMILGVADSMPVYQEETCSTDPKNNNGVCNKNWLYSDISARQGLYFLTDAFKPTRYVTLTPGLAFHMTNSRNDKGQLATDATTFTPHIQAAWDPTHDGKTVLRASFNNYVDHGFLELAALSSRELFNKRCDWDAQAMAYIRNCRSSGGDSGTTIGLPCGPDGLNPDGTSCKTALRLPRVWEYTLGAEREIFTGITLGVDYIYRKFVHQWEDRETNGIWNNGGTGLDRSGMWKSGRSEFVFDLETPDEARRVYHSFTVQSRKREGLLRMELSYTWTFYQGTGDNSVNGSFLDNPGQTQFYYGPLGNDHRHDIRALVTYQVTNWLSAGVIYNFLSGGPYNHYYYDPAYATFNALRTKRGYDTRNTLSLDDDVPLRLPDISDLNLQLRASLLPIIKQRIEFYLDLRNILALRTTTAVIQTDPFFGRQIDRMDPMHVRLGFEYRFR
jgi:hypothetical protein